MRLLLDQCLPRSAVAHLNEMGFDATHAGDQGMAQASDRGLLDYAREEKRVVVTLDADFHHLLVLSSASGPSVIRVREQGLTAMPLSGLIGEVIEQCREELQRGAMVTATREYIRVHGLPVD